jgi:hypothetical protein
VVNLREGLLSFLFSQFSCFFQLSVSLFEYFLVSAFELAQWGYVSYGAVKPDIVVMYVCRAIAQLYVALTGFWLCWLGAPLWDVLGPVSADNFFHVSGMFFILRRLGSELVSACT